MPPNVGSLDAATLVPSGVSSNPISPRGREVQERFVHAFLVESGKWLTAERMANAGPEGLDLDQAVPPEKAAAMLGDLILDMPVGDLGPGLSRPALAVARKYLPRAQQVGLESKSLRQIQGLLNKEGSKELQRLLADGWEKNPALTAALVGTAVGGALAALYFTGTEELEMVGLPVKTKFSLFGGRFRSEVSFHSKPKLEDMEINVATSLKVADGVTVRAATSIDDKGVDTVVGGFAWQASDTVGLSGSYAHTVDRDDREKPEENADQLALRFTLTPNDRLSVYVAGAYDPQAGIESLVTTAGANLQINDELSAFLNGTAKPLADDSFEIKAGTTLALGDGPFDPTATAFAFVRHTAASDSTEVGAGFAFTARLGSTRPSTGKMGRTRIGTNSTDPDAVFARWDAEIRRALEAGDDPALEHACRRMNTFFIKPNPNHISVPRAVITVAETRAGILERALAGGDDEARVADLALGTWIAEIEQRLDRFPESGIQRDRLERILRDFRAAQGG